MAIAIIGGGLSGTLTAIHLLRNASGNQTIYLIEQDRYRMSRGIAYSSQLSFQPLNVPASAMSLFPEQPLDFYDWLKANEQHYEKHLKQPVTKDDFIPRFIFGDYLKARLEEAEKLTPAHVKLIKVYDEAVAIKRSGNLFQIAFKESKTITATKAVLALGNFAPGNLPIPNTGFYQSAAYIASPWSAKGLANLPADAPLLLIGSSLTMVDLVGSLKEEGHSGKIYVLSRHGLLPQPFDVTTRPYPKLKIPVGLSLLSLVKFIRSEIKEAEALGYNWRSVLDAMREAIPVIWQTLPLKEKKQFMRHLRPYWETHRHRMPAGSAALLQDLQEQGRLELIAGTIVDMHELGHKARVTIKRRKQSIAQTIEVSRVINCTGPQSDFAKIDVLLVEQLLASRMIQPDTLKLGLRTAPDGTVINGNGMLEDGFYTIGPPRKATLYESTALREIRQQAKELAQNILQENNLYECNMLVS
ncbi:FAD/NAD(P)-binding protein [Pontibacter sp. H259]|uniref:FAD/NAD(P)-binding protein n=1 Tax=Pontibacter sp. H259 TaxID=3133421 RepID=UPI0030C2663D